VPALSQLVASALSSRSAGVELLVREAVDTELARLVDEALDAELARRRNGDAPWRSGS
jgi:hypothetical protein